MRLTEALYFYNTDPPPTKSWMRVHFSHFEPTVKDYRTRKKYQENLREAKQPRRKIMKDLFA